MKKIQLIAVNSKYMHTNLAVRALRQAALPYEPEITELTVNDELWHSAQVILRKESDIFCFSCYIWNMQRIAQLAEIIKKSRPNCEVFFGGPEVSYDPLEILNQNPAVTGIFCGEGEKAFHDFVIAVHQNLAFDAIPGLQLRENHTELQVVKYLDDWPFPYTKGELIDLKDRILYYESMRGCPFQCAYCLSSTLPAGVRALFLERVFEDLKSFIAADVRQVKFVDRTFNLNPKRAKAILRFLAEQNCRTNFHFEIGADLLDDELMTIIASAPKGRFQFEAGIQSTHLPTLSAVSRKTDLKTLGERVRQLVHCNNAHIHVDLIAGLPYEDFETFGHSYNAAMALRPNMLQLGFLKLLKGTKMREDAVKFGYLFQSFPPYEVIANDFISAKELRILKGIDALTDRYYNSGCFNQTMEAVFDGGVFDSPFEFFQVFSDWWVDEGLDMTAHARQDLYGILFQFLSDNGMDGRFFSDPLIYDALAGGCKKPPKDLPCDGWITGEEAFELVKKEDFIAEAFPELIKEPPKQRVKKLRIFRLSSVFAQYLKAEGETAVFSDTKIVFTQF